MHNAAESSWEDFCSSMELMARKTGDGLAQVIPASGDQPPPTAEEVRAALDGLKVEEQRALAAMYYDPNRTTHVSLVAGTCTPERANDIAHQRALVERGRLLPQEYDGTTALEGWRLSIARKAQGGEVGTTTLSVSGAIALLLEPVLDQYGGINDVQERARLARGKGHQLAVIGGFLHLDENGAAHLSEAALPNRPVEHFEETVIPIGDSRGSPEILNPEGLYDPENPTKKALARGRWALTVQERPDREALWRVIDGSNPISGRLYSEDIERMWGKARGAPLWVIPDRAGQRVIVANFQVDPDTIGQGYHATREILKKKGMGLFTHKEWSMIVQRWVHRGPVSLRNQDPQASFYSWLESGDLGMLLEEYGMVGQEKAPSESRPGFFLSATPNDMEEFLPGDRVMSEWHGGSFGRILVHLNS